MSKYLKSKIYRIYSLSNPEIGEYIGSTIEPFLSNTLAKKKYKYTLYLEGKENLVSVYAILQFDDACIELIEEYPCENINQLRKRTGELMRASSNCINLHIAGRKPAEYYEEHKESILEKNKEYRYVNTEKISEQKRKSYSNNKEVVLYKNKIKRFYKKQCNNIDNPRFK